MSVLIVGTTALDSIKTPYPEKPAPARWFGSVMRAWRQAFSPVKLVGGVGGDFPKKYIAPAEGTKLTSPVCKSCPARRFIEPGEYER